MVKSSLFGLMPKWSALALSVGMIALTGCAQQPVMPEVEQNLPEQWSSSQGSAQTWPDRDWWQAFHSEELTRLVEEALSNNFDVAAAAARILQAEAQVRVSGATLLPGLDLDFRASRQGELGEGGSSSYGAGLSASYEIDFWGKNRAALRSEEHTSELQSRPHLVCRLLLEKKKHKSGKHQLFNVVESDGISAESDMRSVGNAEGWSTCSI